MRSPEPILTIGLFPELRQHLLELLVGLAPDEWALPTAAKKWSVKDVALHLLAGDIGILSRKRDAFTPGGPISGWEDLVALINRLNEEWVVATRRLSSRVLCDLLAHTGPQVEAYFASLDPFAVGGPVDWAGEEPAPVWLDLAREYTERWHHQQQIRDATGRPGLYEPHLFAPVLDAFVRALPHTFRNVAAEEGTLVQVTILGPAGGEWLLRRSATTWTLLSGSDSTAAAHVTVAGEDAWKIFTRGIRPDEALRRAEIRGNATLGAQVLKMVSVIA
jgi:uncharacterized protein (TIGR03083 family)